MTRFVRSLCVVLLVVVAVPMDAQLLYKVSGNGCAAPSYIFATNRLAPISFLDTVPNLFKCYGKSTCVVTEFTLMDYECQRILRQSALLPDSLNIHNTYSAEEYKELDEALQLTLGMGLNKLGRIKPQYLTELYRIELFRRFLSYDDDKSSQHFFEAVAQQQGRPVYGLDNAGEAMFMLFDREPYHWQCEELLALIRYPERDVRLERQLAALYTQGRLLDMAYAVSSPDNQATISYSDYQIYARRNEQWVKRLAPFLKDGKAFIVLDAVYLGGEKGLLQLLRAAGYKVRPVNRK